MTTKTFQTIRELNGRGMSDTEIAKIIGVTPKTASKWRVRLNLPKQKQRKRKSYESLNQYAVYDSNTEVLLAMGSAEECAKALGIQRRSFYRAVCDCKHKQTKKSKRKFVLLEKEERFLEKEFEA